MSSWVLNQASRRLDPVEYILRNKRDSKGEKLLKFLVKGDFERVKLILTQEPYLCLYGATYARRNILQSAIFLQNIEFIKFIINFAKENLTPKLYDYFINNPGGTYGSYYSWIIEKKLDFELVYILINFNIPIRINEILLCICRGEHKTKLCIELFDILIFKLKHNFDLSENILTCTFSLLLETVTLYNSNFSIILETFSKYNCFTFETVYEKPLILLTEYLNYEFDDFSEHKIKEKNIFLDNIKMIFILYFGNHFFEKISNYIMHNFTIKFNGKSGMNYHMENLANSYSFITCRKSIFDHKIFSNLQLVEYIIKYL